MFDNCISKNVLGHVPFNCSNLAAKFLQLVNNYIRVVATGTRLNLGAKFDMEIPLD